MYGHNRNEFAAPPRQLGQRSVSASQPLELLDSLTNLQMNRSSSHHHPKQAQVQQEEITAPPTLTRPRSMQWPGGPTRSKVSLRAIMQREPSVKSRGGGGDLVSKVEPEVAPTRFFTRGPPLSESVSIGANVTPPSSSFTLSGDGHSSSNHSCSPTALEEDRSDHSASSFASRGSRLPQFTAEPPPAVAPLARGTSDRQAFMQIARSHLSPMEVDLVENALCGEPQPRRQSLSLTLSSSSSPLGMAVGIQAPPVECDASFPATTTTRTTTTTTDLSSRYELQGASEHLSEQELRDIEMALRASEQDTTSGTSALQSIRAPLPPLCVEHANDVVAPALAERRSVDLHPPLPKPEQPRSYAQVSSVNIQGSRDEDMSEEEKMLLEVALRASLEETSSSSSQPNCIEASVSAAEAAAIEQALREADEEQERQSIQLAMRMVEEEGIGSIPQQQTPRGQQGNVRTMTRQQLEEERALETRIYQDDPSPTDDVVEEPERQAGFQINSNSAGQDFSRLDRNMIVGPDDEIQTKHDVKANGLANAYRLGIDTEDQSSSANVSNTAFNSFKETVRRQHKSGTSSETAGGGKHSAKKSKSAEEAPTAAKEWDPDILWEITRAVNNGWITKCNGVVNKGTESSVYHGSSGFQSEGFDVAIKVFEQQSSGQRISLGSSGRQEHPMAPAAEKEYENLVRANLAGVPVPTPLMQESNILFMRFLGGSGWPAPQLKELGVRKGSRKWKMLYTQTIESVRRLFRSALMVHGDLSESSILAVPANNIDNWLGGDGNEVQVALIDFGHAVDARHPEAYGLLRQDLERIHDFFSKQGVSTIPTEEAFALITGSSMNGPGSARGGHSISASELTI